LLVSQAGEPERPTVAGYFPDADDSTVPMKMNMSNLIFADGKRKG
jgi:hypothetical protein